MSSIEIPSRRNARNLGVSEVPQKGGGAGYRVKRGGTGGSGNSSTANRGHEGLNQHNCPLSFRLQPKRAREI